MSLRAPVVLVLTRSQTIARLAATYTRIHRRDVRAGYDHARGAYYIQSEDPPLYQWLTADEVSQATERTRRR